ncbi:ABC transporter permease [Streptomyces shenzhenensis]|uniref:ABC transporter permease n=1 Tax=Streptomyces shenzhenensis TaxID=943815 RepID=UPI0036AAC119
MSLVWKTTRTLAALLLLFFVVGPLIWLGVLAFAGDWRSPDLLPSTWTLQWWDTVFSDSRFLDSVVLSFTTAPLVTFISMAICLPAAYAFARFDFPGRQFFLIGIFATNAFPRFGLFIAMASLFYTLDLMNSFAGVIIVQLVGTIVFMTWIPAAAFAAIPRSVEEAARDAGAGALRVFFRITLPMAAPGIIVAVILSFLAAFDEAQGTFLVGNPDYVTMPTQMYQLIGHYPRQVSAVFSVLLSIPSVVLLLLVRKRVTGGAVAEGFQLR